MPIPFQSQMITGEGKWAKNSFSPLLSPTTTGAQSSHALQYPKYASAVDPYILLNCIPILQHHGTNKIEDTYGHIFGHLEDLFRDLGINCLLISCLWSRLLIDKFCNLYFMHIVDSISPLFNLLLVWLLLLFLFCCFLIHKKGR